MELKALQRTNRPGATWMRLRRRTVRKDEAEDPPLRLLKRKKEKLRK